MARFFSIAKYDFMLLKMEMYIRQGALWESPGKVSRVITLQTNTDKPILYPLSPKVINNSTNLTLRNTEIISKMK